MKDIPEEKRGFFEYVRLAKEEYQNLIAVYPELGSLSNKEMEVFELLLTDMTMVQMAQRLYLSQSAIHFHCKNIYKKLNVSSRRQFFITYAELCRQKNQSPEQEKGGAP